MGHKVTVGGLWWAQECTRRPHWLPLAPPARPQLEDSGWLGFRAKDIFSDLDLVPSQERSDSSEKHDLRSRLLSLMERNNLERVPKVPVLFGLSLSFCASPSLSPSFLALPLLLAPPPPPGPSECM